MSIVLDASALLAFLHDEPGSDKVDAVIGQSIITTVNWSEVAQKSLSRGVDIDGLLEDIQSLGVSIEVFTLEDAESDGQVMADYTLHRLIAWRSRLFGVCNTPSGAGSYRRPRLVKTGGKFEIGYTGHEISQSTVKSMN